LNQQNLIPLNPSPIQSIEFFFGRIMRAMRTTKKRQNTTKFHCDDKTAKYYKVSLWRWKKQHHIIQSFILTFFHRNNRELVVSLVSKWSIIKIELDSQKKFKGLIGKTLNNVCWSFSKLLLNRTKKLRGSTG
jgi:hypothetical protein